MAITRSSKGTASSKTSGTTLTISGVQLGAGRTVYVAIAWEDGAQSDKPTLKWGNKDMKYVAGSEQTRGDTVLRWYKKKIRRKGTKDISATWTNAKLARAMFATQVNEASIKDVQAGRGEASGTTPATSTPGAAPDTTVADTMNLAAFAMLGPTTDAAATAGAGHTIGQRVGTSGGGAASNITLQETYEILSAIGACRSTITLTTARQAASSIVAWKATTYTVSAADYLDYDGHPLMEVVRFTIEDETSTDVFVVDISRDEFNLLTDSEVEERIRADCQWWDSKVNDAAPSPDFTPDDTFNTRVSSFVNDTFTV